MSDRRMPVLGSRWIGPTMCRMVALVIIIGLYGVPLLAALVAALMAAWLPGLMPAPVPTLGADGPATMVSPGGWRWLADPQTVPAGLLSIGTAVASTLLALGLTLSLATAFVGSTHWTRLSARLGLALAVPHAAFAIGLSLLIMPAGWLARLLAWPLGWDTPPDWVTVHDPAGLSLVLALVGKEVPFLLWSVAALFARPEVARELHSSLLLGRSLGHRPAHIWWTVLWPRWLPALAWPLLAVLAYSLTVVDVALVIGPTQPPTLAVLAWQALSDADARRNAEGAAMAWSLTAVQAVIALLAWAAVRLWQAVMRRWAIRGPAAPTVTRRGQESAPDIRRHAGPLALLRFGIGLYAVVALALCLASVSGVWRFPAGWPQVWSLEAWRQVLGAASTLGVTAALALVASAAATALTLLWLECTPAHWDRVANVWVLAPLVLPQLLLMSGLYRLALSLHLDGTWLGLAGAHTLFALPYVFIALAPSWRHHDPRWALTAAALGQSRWRFLWRVKWPMLRAPLASALAIGCAVSVAQYLSTQFLGAGRWATITTEAVTLAADGQRLQASALAVLQALLPLLAFGAAAWAGRSPALAHPTGSA